MNPQIFRAYDIRGKYPADINEKIIFEIIFSFISKIKNQNPKVKIIVVGHDARLSSPSLYKTVLKSLKLKTHKLKPVPAGMTTTPMLYFLTNKLNADLGIMITASHSPKEYNGLKIVGKNAVPINGKEILKWIT